MLAYLGTAAVVATVLEILAMPGQAQYQALVSHGIHTNPTVDRGVYNGVDMAVPRVVTADDLRSQLGRELDQLRSSEEVLFVSKRGRLAAVLIDVEQYRAMVERAEYLEDSLAALQAREEVDQAISWSKVRK